MVAEVTVHWSTPTGAVDERLTVTSTGEARLLVLAPQSDGAQVGEFSGRAGPQEYAALAALGARWSIDPAHGSTNPEAALATEIADRCRSGPVSAASFVLHAGAAEGSRRQLTLGVIGRGQQACRFVLDLDRCRIRFVSDGEVVAEQPLSPLAAGFMTGDAEGLGGVRQIATVPPGTLGAIVLEVSVPGGATHLESVLVGSWYAGDADQTAPPERFTAHAVAELSG